MLLELECGDAPERWAALGFVVDDRAVRVGTVTVWCDGAGGGLRGWTLSSADASDGCASCDGIPTRWSDAPPTTSAAGVFGLDHVVVLTDSLDRTVTALVGVGGDERHRAAPPGVPAPMAFVRLGAVIVEVVQGGGPTRLWGLTAVVDDLGSLPADLVGAPRDAVQRGRRIVTVRREAGLETAVAFMAGSNPVVNRLDSWTLVLRSDHREDRRLQRPLRRAAMLGGLEPVPGALAHAGVARRALLRGCLAVDQRGQARLRRLVRRRDQGCGLRAGASRSAPGRGRRTA